ncbi:endonuclease/exonuclease/phosphatase family protein [Myroides sp. LJL116]
MLKSTISYKVFLLSLFLSLSVFSQEKEYEIQTIAFYNVENLFDTKRDTTIYDQEWTPQGAQNWTTEKYQKKIHNLARVMSEIGRSENPKMPAVIGVAEIENRGVLEDLVNDPLLVPNNYGIVHYDSPDKRGIDVGFLYSRTYFQPLSSQVHTLYIYDNKKLDSKTGEPQRIYTRDQLVVSGLLEGEQIHFIVNHWPSRSGGEKRSSPLREAAAALNVTIIDSLQSINPNAKIITMGDMNDGPYNNSIKKVLNAKDSKSKVEKFGLYNPFEKLAKEGNGTLAYRDAWDVFDQIILSEPYLQDGYDTWKFWKAQIFKKPFMIQTSGKYKGYPLRNSNGEPGFSDHFPVYIYLIREAK